MCDKKRLFHLWNGVPVAVFNLPRKRSWILRKANGLGRIKFWKSATINQIERVGWRRAGINMQYVYIRVDNGRSKCGEGNADPDDIIVLCNFFCRGYRSRGVEASGKLPTQVLEYANFTNTWSLTNLIGIWGWWWRALAKQPLTSIWSIRCGVFV